MKLLRSVSVVAALAACSVASAPRPAAANDGAWVWIGYIVTGEDDMLAAVNAYGYPSQPSHFTGNASGENPVLNLTATSGGSTANVTMEANFGSGMGSVSSKGSSGFTASSRFQSRYRWEEIGDPTETPDWVPTHVRLSGSTAVSGTAAASPPWFAQANGSAKIWGGDVLLTETTGSVTSATAFSAWTKNYAPIFTEGPYASGSFTDYFLPVSLFSDQEVRSDPVSYSIGSYMSTPNGGASSTAQAAVGFGSLEVVP